MLGICKENTHINLFVICPWDDYAIKENVVRYVWDHKKHDFSKKCVQVQSALKVFYHSAEFSVRRELKHLRNLSQILLQKKYTVVKRDQFVLTKDA